MTKAIFVSTGAGPYSHLYLYQSLYLYLYFNHLLTKPCSGSGAGLHDGLAMGHLPPHRDLRQGRGAGCRVPVVGNWVWVAHICGERGRKYIIDLLYRQSFLCE